MDSLKSKLSLIFYNQKPKSREEFDKEAATFQQLLFENPDIFFYAHFDFIQGCKHDYATISAATAFKDLICQTPQDFKIDPAFFKRIYQYFLSSSEKMVRKNGHRPVVPSLYSLC
jgi:hypothetical protein